MSTWCLRYVLVTWAQAGRVVTPEAVELELPTANVGSRFLAFLIDVLVQGALMALAGVVVGLLVSGTDVPAWETATLTTSVVFFVYLGYPIAFETLWRGRTFGKPAL